VVCSSTTTAHAHRIAHRLLVDPPAAAALPSHIWRTRQVGELSTRTARSEARAGDAEINASEARAFAGGVDSRLNELRLETTQAARELWAYVDEWKIWKTAQEQV
jgi:hypothetical protein